MAKDQLGLPLAGGSDTARAYDRAVPDYWGLTGDPVGVLKQALAVDPAFLLGAAATAGFFLIGGFRGDHPEVVGALPRPAGRARRLAARAAGSGRRPELAGGRLPDAALAWEAILVDGPTDALALRFGQDADFFLGRSLALRDSVARALPTWQRKRLLGRLVRSLSGSIASVLRDRRNRPA